MALLECISFALFWYRYGKPFSYSRIRIEQEEAAELSFEIKNSPKEKRKAKQSLHPYLGFVRNPETNKSNFHRLHRYPVNRFGFIDDRGPINSRHPDKVLIGITGGSVAFWFSVMGSATLAMELKKDDRFCEKEIVFVRFAMGGYKQPQQLMALNYMLALGGELDYLINIDGFNEVALPGPENVKVGVFPFFPRDWKGRLERLPDLETQLIAGEALYLVKMRRELARTFLKWKTRYSVTLQLFWKFLDDKYRYRTAEAHMTLKYSGRKSTSFTVTGPGTDYFTEENLHTELAEFWKRCSIQLRNLCRANGIRYFHFLQPCQYVEGSKPMGEEEKRIAIKEDHPYREGVVKGYPEMRVRGKDLEAGGVHFTDLTLLFADIEEPLYIDNCCHFNEKGNRIMARMIASVILEVKDEP